MNNWSISWFLNVNDFRCFVSWIDLKEQCLALQTSVCKGPSDPSPFTRKSSSIEALPVCRTLCHRGQSPRSQYTWNKLVSSHTPLKLVTFIYFYQNDRKMMLNHDKLWSTIIGFGKPTFQRNPHGTMDRRKSTGPLVRCKGTGHCAGWHQETPTSTSHLSSPPDLCWDQRLVHSTCFILIKHWI